jgi:hypothetical protein
MRPATERTGLLIIRVWIGEDADTRPRARITQLLDLAAPHPVVTAAQSAEAIHVIVQRWLEAFLAAALAAARAANAGGDLPEDSDGSVTEE